MNFERNGYSVSVYDLNSSFDKSFFEAKNISVFNSQKDLADSLAKPRRILIIVPAGKAVDNAVTSIKRYLEKGDILIDGGNSFFTDTDRRLKQLDKDGIQFLGIGISGGEERAQWGASLMPGGAASAWKEVTGSNYAVMDILQLGCITIHHRWSLEKCSYDQSFAFPQTQKMCHIVCIPAHVDFILTHKKPVGVRLLSLPNIKNRSPVPCWIALISTSKSRV